MRFPGEREGALRLRFQKLGVGERIVVLSLAVAIAAAVFGWMRRRELGVVLLVGYLPAALIIGRALAIQVAGRA